MEDGGAGINYYLYAYTWQPGVKIDYETGHNWLADDASSQTSGAGGQNGTRATTTTTGSGQRADLTAPATARRSGGSSDVAAGEQGSQTPAEAQDYVLNTSSRKFHYPWCDSVEDISPENREGDSREPRHARRVELRAVRGMQPVRSQRDSMPRAATPQISNTEKPEHEARDSLLDGTRVDSVFSYVETGRHPVAGRSRQRAGYGPGLRKAAERIR